MASQTKFYDASQVTLLIGGVPIKDAPGDPFVEVAARGPGFEDEKGVDGTVCRFATNEPRWDVTITLRGWSEDIPYLAGLYAADKAAGNGAGVGAFMLKDGSGTTIMSSDICYITTPVPKAFGMTLPDVTINVTVVEKSPLGMLAGGN